MTLSALGVTAVYVGSGSSGPFTLEDDAAQPILFENNSEIVVHRTGMTGEYGAVDLQVITADYTLTGAGSDTAGSVTLIDPLTVGELLMIRRVTPFTQTLDLEFGGTLSLENLEEALDKQMRLIQELREQTERAMLFSATETDLVGTNARVMPAPVAGQVLVWNASADQLENADGNLLYSGTATPTSDLGGDGDFYLDTDDMLLYGPKVGSDWGSGTSLTGPAGPVGPEGPIGPTGASGSGTGDVVGPGSATDDNVASFDGATGKIIQDSGITIASITNAYRAGGTDVALADGGTGASLVDPNADRMLFWDDSAGAVTFLAASTGLAISGTNLSLSHLGLQSLVDPNADRIFFWDDSAGAAEWLTPANGLEISTTSLQLTTNSRLINIPFIIDGGGLEISDGLKGDLVIPFACTITGWTLLADQSGSIVVDIWKDTYANYPPTVADTITAADKPTISAAVKGQDLAPTGWTTAVAAGDILRFNVDSCTTITRVTLNLLATRT